MKNANALLAPSTPFEASAATRWVNRLWFSSLMFSLTSALGVSLAKGWVTQFSSTVSGSSWGDAQSHSKRYRELARWHLDLIVQCLPILIHIAFFLLSIGPVIMLLGHDRVIGVSICVLTVLVAVLYLASSFPSAWFEDSPFHRPISGFIRGVADRFSHGPSSPTTLTKFLTRPDAQKVQALTWLLT
jgi:hypothetical protein